MEGETDETEEQKKNFILKYVASDKQTYSDLI